MSGQPLPLSPTRAVAFHQAYEDRDAYIAEQPGPVRHRIGFEESVPLPGCPYCWREAGAVRWDVLAHEVWTAIEPCGHWFSTARPITVVRSVDGWPWVEEWLP
ncbi:hypothetical protein AB0F46_29510 [Streptomyces sp. NPDC026665]|uniref:hypothetical protein n=1 Tax=Streptomyces sp. NPDC026665 TaxID=3154798 RepID=UPI0033C53975